MYYLFLFSKCLIYIALFQLDFQFFEGIDYFVFNFKYKGYTYMCLCVQSNFVLLQD